MSIASQITRIQNNIAAAYTACNSKGATIPQQQNSANLANTINSIQTGGGSVTPKHVNFYDYDGTLLHAYTAAEIDAMSALPALPSHTGLVAQGWNWTLAQIKSQLTNVGGCVDVGCMYNTDDGSTKLYFPVEAGTKLPDYSIVIYLDAGESATFDWGDGTSSTVTNAQNSAGFVTASKSGSAVVSEDTLVCVRIVGGSFELGSGNSYGAMTNLFGYRQGVGISSCPILTKVETGTNCKGIRDFAFQDCFCLESITLHSLIANIRGGSFKYLPKIKAVIFPTGCSSVYDGSCSNCSDLSVVSLNPSITSISGNAFSQCKCLERVCLPQSVTSILQSAFENDNALKEIVIPESVTIIGKYAFQYCLANRKLILNGGSAIEDAAFAYNYLIQKIVIKNGTRILNTGVFRDCSHIYRIVIPSSVTEIKNDAFRNDDAMRIVDLTDYDDPSAIPSLANNYVFSADVTFLCSSQTMIDAFRAATNWSSYASTQWEVEA